MLVLHVPPTCSPTALRSPGARLCVRAASVRPSERLVVGRVVRCQLVLTRCSFMYGEGLMAGAVRAAHSTRLCPVLTVTAVSPSIVPAALLKSTMSFAPTPRTHVSNLKWHLKEYSKWKRFRIVPVIGRTSLPKYQWEVGNTGSQHASRAWRIRAGAYPPPNTLRYNLRETGLSA